MNIEGYRRLQQRILLPVTGNVPSDPLSGTEEQESALARIERTWQLIGHYPSAAGRQGGFAAPSETEIWIAFKRWFASHHLFIPPALAGG